MNTQLTAAQAAHAFDAGCVGSVPSLMPDRAEIFATAFHFKPFDAGTDAAYRSSFGGVTVTLDGNPLAATCEMTLAPEIGGDGADLYDTVVNHLIEKIGSEPEADYTDGGVIWSWQGSNASYTYSYTETADGFVLSLKAES